MSENLCPIGLKDNCISILGVSCVNLFDCHSWTLPWPLPVTRVTYENNSFDPLTFDSPYWLVQFRNLYPPVNSEGEMIHRDWEKYFADYGYAQAEPLYARCPKSLGWYYDKKSESWEPKK